MRETAHPWQLRAAQNAKKVKNKCKKCNKVLQPCDTADGQTEGVCLECIAALLISGAR